MFSDDGGASWSTIKAYVDGGELIDDGSWVTEALTIDSGSYSFTSTVKIRFESMGSNNSDEVFIDNLKIEAK